MKNRLPFLFVCIVFISCNPMRSYPSIEQISFGSGGGITGEVITNNLDRSGVVRQNGLKIQTIDLKKTAELFSYTQKLKSDTLNNPGNIYQFIEFTDHDGQYRYVWNNRSDVSEELKNWYAKLSELIEK